MSLRDMPPCKKDGHPCEKRYVGCHAKCKDFIEWKEARNELLAKKAKQDSINRQLNDASFQRVMKSKEGGSRKWR